MRGPSSYSQGQQLLFTVRESDQITVGLAEGKRPWPSRGGDCSGGGIYIQSQRDDIGRGIRGRPLGRGTAEVKRLRP